MTILPPTRCGSGAVRRRALVAPGRGYDACRAPKDAKRRRLGALAARGSRLAARGSRLAARDDYAFGAAPKAYFTPVSSSDIDQSRAASSSLFEDLLVVAFTASPRISFQPFGPV